MKNTHRGPAAPLSDRPHAGRLFFPLFGAFVVLVGLALAFGGAWLLWLGGSSWYLIAALVSLAAGTQLWRRRVVGVWLISGLTLATLVWAILEVGYDGWAMIPRLDWLIVLCLVLLLAARPLRHGLGMTPAAHLGATGVPALLGLAAILLPLIWPTNVQLADPALAVARPNTPFNQAQPGAEDGNVAATHDETNWTAYAGSNLSNHFSPAAQITPANVSQLSKAWEFHTGDLPKPGEGIEYLSENTPLKVDDLVYVCTPTQQVIALDAKSGQERWRFDPKADRKALKTAGAYCRGVAYFKAPTATPDCPTRILWGITGGRLAAVDARSGQLCKSFGEDGYVDLKKHLGDFVPGYFGNTSAPIVLRGKVIIGHMVRDGQDRLAPSGVVRAFDAVTGQFAWAWDIGRPGHTQEPGPGETYTPGTPNVWAPLAADDRLGLVYLPTGNAAGDFWASTRSPLEEEYTSSLVAVDADTGQVRWHFRTVNHDLWDFDIGPQPNLIDWPTAQGAIPAVIQATKSGQVFVLDRRSGLPLMPVEQLPVPQGADGGNWTAPTQPFSTGMPNTVGAPSKQAERLEEADAWGISPFDQLQCRIEFRRMRYDGMFTPPMVGGTLAYPGNHGGLNWGGVSVDLGQGIMVMNSNRLPYMERLVTREDIDTQGARSLSQGGPSKGLMPQVGLPIGAQKAPWLSVLKTPCIAPPWGYLTGVDLRTQNVVWRRPLGSGRDTGPLGIPSGVSLQMGTPSDSGPLTTGGGVTFIGAALDYEMRAFDTQNGRLLWQTRLEAGAQGSPLSYIQDGRQYVVAVVGGHDRLSTRIGDSVIAWALPEQGARK